MDNKNKLDGYWRLDYNDSLENPFFPFEVQFNSDSIKMVDGNTFSHCASYIKRQDSLDIMFSNSTKVRLSFDMTSDSIIKISNETFYRVRKDDFSEVKNYELLGFVTEKTLEDNPNTTVIHLVKVNNSPKVILNTVVTDLNHIHSFLTDGHGEPPPILIYIGKGIKLDDLIEAYNWVFISGIRKVTLVLAHNGLSDYFILNDKIELSDSLIEEFAQVNRIPPLPPTSNPSETFKRIQISIEDSTQFSKLNFLNDSSFYHIDIDRHIGFLEYLKLKKLIEGKQNIKTEIKRLTPKKMH